MPTIVCLCGSTRFGEAFRAANLAETLAGKIVLSIGCDMRSDTELFADKGPQELEQIKADLDTLHLRKIDMADEVLVLNVGGYIGESTRRELQYALERGKQVLYLESVNYEICFDAYCASEDQLLQMGCYEIYKSGFVDGFHSRDKVKA